MRTLVTGIMILLSQYLIAQSSWTFEPNIEFERYWIYEGTIDNKYPITMYLEESAASCSDSPSRSTPHIVYGWYMYNKFGKKIPLIGNVCYADMCESYLKLFVPEDPIEYSFDENCDLINAKETFIQEMEWGSNKMEWRMKQGETHPVFIESKHSFSWETKAFLVLKIGVLDIQSFDLSKLAENKYIEEINILTQKKVGEYFHVIFKYSHQSNPGSFGHGNCGAGIEEFIGYLKVNMSFDIESFNYIQTYSCIESFEVEVVYDSEHPENGIKKN